MALFKSLGFSFEVTCLKDIVDKLNEMSDKCQDDLSVDNLVIKHHGYNHNSNPQYVITENGGILGYVDKFIPYTTTPRYKI